MARGGKEYEYQKDDRAAAIRRRRELVRKAEMMRNAYEEEQAKLEINGPGDKYEQEADDVARKVVSGEWVNEVTFVSSGIQKKHDNVHNDKKSSGFVGTKLFNREEIDPELQEHLRNEFDAYVDQKLKMIANGTDNVMPGQKFKTKDEKRNNFLHKKEVFQRKMLGRKKSYWGTKKYERLLAKWLPDYQDVIQNKVSDIKAKINQSIVQTNKSIEAVIFKLAEALNSSSTELDSVLKLLDEANMSLAKANDHKQNANKTLGEYSSDNLTVYMSSYDQVVLAYTQLISELTKNIDGIRQDQVRLNQIIAGLSTQQLQLTQFNAKVDASTDVLKLISLEKNEFPRLIDNARATVTAAGQANRMVYADETGTQSKIKTNEEQITTLDTSVEELKRKEIKRREEEKKKKEEEIRRKKEEEERLKKARQQKTTPQTTASEIGDVPPIFIRKTTVTTTTAKPSFTNTGDIVRTRGGTDYTKESWNEKNSLKEANSTIVESSFSQTAKDFFAKYKKTCDAYLEAWYKGKNVSKKLTGDMFVNAAKRIYTKYEHLSYIVPAEMALVQSRLETGLGTTGLGNYNNPFNVGEYDTGPTSWTKDISSPEIGIYFYMDVMANDYLSAKTADQLLKTQGISFVNEKGSRYASAPRYEMTLKAMMGQVGLVRDSKQPQVAVGRNKQKNDGTESATFVRDMLRQLGYTQAGLGDAIEAFQRTEMYPTLTSEQKKLVDKMSPGDRKNFDIQEKTGVDGVVNPNGNTVGLLYYMTSMGNTLTNFSGTNVTVTDPAAGKVQSFYDQYKNGKIDMIALGVNIIPYCRYYADDVITIMDQLGWSTEDNLAYVLANKSTDQQLKYFDGKLLKRMKNALDPANNWTNIDKKKAQWERIKTALGENNTSATSNDAEKDNTKGTKNTKRISIPVDFKISASVGAGGENVVEDVKKIQDLLINFNYLKENDSEVSLVTETIKNKPRTKLKDSQLDNTIAAIKQFQKYGATTGTTLFKQDGKVEKSGSTITAMRELNSVDVNYKDQKFEEDIPDVLTKEQWVSQFRYGYNFKDGEDNLEKEYVEFVKKETGLSDPADLGTAKEASIKTVKDEYAKKGAWFDQKKTLSDHGLKMHQKSRNYKPNYVCCWDAANTILGFSGTSEQGNNFKIQTYVADQVKNTVNGKSQTTVENGKFTNQMPLGIKYIDGQLKAGHAVFIGVEKGKAKDQNEFVTDHFIVIVGKHKDDSGKYYYSFFDPGTANEGYDTKKNRLSIATDNTSVQNSSYKLSQIRTNNE